MTSQLKELLEMLNNKVNLFAVIERAESIGFEISSRATPGIRAEIEELIAHAELSEEAQSLTVRF